MVHRLDKDTSGIVLVAKTDNMMNYLSSIIKDRKIKKTYIAIVDGIIKENNFRVESYI
ncbi:MAG: pseudouridine synthase [Patescibacteria group bacterium]|nr:pseudouridine synthase [Patescibacteria group bacterium]